MAERTMNLIVVEILAVWESYFQRKQPRSKRVFCFLVASSLHDLLQWEKQCKRVLYLVRKQCMQ